MIDFMKQSSIQGLEWYRNRANHGRGRVSSEDSTLIRQGLLTMRWTSKHCWVLMITAKGHQALDKQTRPLPNTSQQYVFRQRLIGSDGNTYTVTHATDVQNGVGFFYAECEGEEFEFELGFDGRWYDINDGQTALTFKAAN